LKAIAIKQKKQISDLKQFIENEIKKHNQEKSELLSKMAALAEQGKLARVRIYIFILKIKYFKHKFTIILFKNMKIKSYITIFCILKYCISMCYIFILVH
jgi:hypothetical protein